MSFVPSSRFIQPNTPGYKLPHKEAVIAASGTVEVNGTKMFAQIKCATLNWMGGEKSWWFHNPNHMTLVLQPHQNNFQTWQILHIFNVQNHDSML